jgi:ABC-type transport system involved in cytochrome c biogenesis ATPase subunit
LLRLLAGLLKPVKGAITERPSVVGYAPERFPADQPFTVAAYLRHMAAIRRVDPGRAMEWAERLGMEHQLGHRLPDLSKGSAHKVGLAQALLCGPRLLILDEPFAGLDARTRAELPLVLGEVAAGGGIVIVSDHQGDLRTFPGLRRLEVRNATIRELPMDPPTARDGEPLALLEVSVAASRAAELAARLRAEGHAVQITQPATQSPADEGSTQASAQAASAEALVRAPAVGVAQPSFQVPAAHGSVRATARVPEIQGPVATAPEVAE